MLAHHCAERGLDNLVVAAPDVGAAKRARETADLLRVPIAIVEKQRLGNDDKVEATNLIGDVEGRTALIVDDEVVTGGTVAAAAEVLLGQGATAVYCYATHPVLSGNARRILEDSSVVQTVVTDTLPIDEDKLSPGIKTVSVASLLGEAIHRIHSGLSVGAMFEP